MALAGQAQADINVPARLAAAAKVREQAGFLGLFAALSAYTLSTMDGGDIAPRIISAVLLLVTAYYFGVPFQQSVTFSLPTCCLLLMACYGVCQTLWSPQKIVYDGVTGVLFWFTAALIALLASQVFQDRAKAIRFRFVFVIFGSGVCLLDLLEQASRTNRYLWLIPSRYHSISGSFAYWNNFAQFVELVLPITLWLGLARRKPAPSYLLLSALEIGAVAASGSRAGAFLVIVELITVLMLVYLQNRNRTFLYSASLVVALSTIFVYAAGFDTLVGKLQQNDQLNVRREIDKSSLDMIRQRPLTGWGLDTYVPVYRMFARYDDGTYVNRAHNDWLQWAAEGGIFFSGCMLVIFLWSLRPAIRSVWGIGVIAVCLHALVDYPFARFGVCGWYFALLGMLAAYREEGLPHR
ncbi:MAG: O-antigen ligase family protein [Bryobacteraceae bacterium]